MTSYNLQDKVGRVLHIILLTLILIFIRVWYLTVVQKDEYFEQSKKPQRRITLEHVERATIRDRFNMPLAINKIQYNIAVCYAQIREIPSSTWGKDESGKKVRIPTRANYISTLGELLANILHMNPQEIEDTIHGKASLFPHTPFVIKEDISEKQYYQLKMLEKSYPGIQTIKGSKRVYPQGKIASDVIGFLGTINQREYGNIAKELRELQKYIADRESGLSPFLPKGFSNPLEVRERLKFLSEKAYTICDHVGKMGTEGAFDEELRGCYGKKIYEIDTKGNFLRELPGSKEGSAGRRIILTISSELQEYAEALLAQNECAPKKGSLPLSSAWIKGGAIVALVPQTGEVLTLASYPRFDPNDFIPTFDPAQKKEQLYRRLKWVENEAHIKEIWDGIHPLEKECYSFASKSFYEESVPLTWERYLEAALSPKSQLLTVIQKVPTIKTAYDIQRCLNTLLEYSSQSDMRALLGALYSENTYKPFRLPVPKETKKEIQENLKKMGDRLIGYRNFLDPFFKSITHQDDQLLLVDLCRMMVKIEDFSPELLEVVGQETLSFYKELTSASTWVQSKVKQEVQKQFHKTTFAAWRQEHFKDHLKEKRAEEKLKKRYAKPYTEYLENIEKELFKEFWQKERLSLIENLLTSSNPTLLDKEPKFILLKESLAKLKSSLRKPYLNTMRSFDELKRPLLGKYRSVRSASGKQLEKHLAAAFYPISGFGYGRSQAFRQSTPQGSVFKLVTSYEALKEQYDLLIENKKTLEELNPLTLIDDIKAEGISSKEGQYLGNFLNGTTIRRKYKGGVLPRSHPYIGQIDIVGALEQSSNLYFSILASDYIQDPTYLGMAARQMGYGEKSGIELPGEIAGTIPSDLSHNRTGLYSFSIGQHSLVVTPLQTAVMLSTIANHGNVIKPKVVKVIAGKEEDKNDLFSIKDYPLKEDLSLIGVEFPLFSEAKPKEERPSVCYTPLEVKRSLFFPEQIRDLLLEGMQKVVRGTRGTGRASILKAIPDLPSSIRDYIEIQNQVVAKTGTAEILYKHAIDHEVPPVIENHVWFAGISFHPPKEGEKWGEPELVVVVYLRFGKAGKDCAPIASQIIKKWRELCAKHGCTSSFKDE